MRTGLLVCLGLLLASPAWASGKCCPVRGTDSACQPLVYECCGEFVNTCVMAKYSPGCPPEHQCPETCMLCCPSPSPCPPEHKPLEFACIEECRHCLPPVCHKPVVLLELLEPCELCGD